MVDSFIHKQRNEQLDRLPLELQRRVLQYAFDVVSALPVAVPGVTLLRFADAIPKDDLHAMGRAIEEGCEQIVY